MMTNTWQSKKIHIDELKILENNPRTITDKQFKKFERDHKLGIFKPIVINKDKTILAGNQRYQYYKKQNIDKVWCSVPNRQLSKEDAKEIILLDNTHRGEFDLDILLEEFEESIKDLDLDIELQVVEPEVEEDDFDVEEVEKNIHNVQKGDIYQLGEHRLMCGDATSIDDVEKLMDGNKADMVFTDPPYNTGMTSNKRGKGERVRLDNMFDDKYTDQEWQDFMQLFMSSYSIVMKDNSVAYVCLDWRRSYELIPHIKDYFHLSNVIVWDKVVHGLGSDYKYTYELIHVCKKGRPNLNTHQGDREYSDVWHIQRTMGRDEEHATKKPIELCSRAVRHASNKDDIVLDLFGGSGSTLIACEQLNRKCYMMELDEHYCSVIIERWQRLTGESAVKL